MAVISPRRIAKFLVLSLLGLVLSWDTALALRVAVLTDDPSAPTAQLAASGLFTAVEAMPLSPSPGLPQLAAYDAVLAYPTPAAVFDRVTVGDALADYADAGAGVVLAQHCFNLSPAPAVSMQGRIMSVGYSPWALFDAIGVLAPTLSPLAGHPVFHGVDVAGVQYDAQHLFLLPQDNSPLKTLAWTEPGGIPLMAVNTARPVMAVNFNPSASLAGNNGDFYTLLASALAHVARKPLAGPAAGLRKVVATGDPKPPSDVFTDLDLRAATGRGKTAFLGTGAAGEGLFLDDGQAVSLLVDQATPTSLGFASHSFSQLSFDGDWAFFRGIVENPAGPLVSLLRISISEMLYSALFDQDNYPGLSDLSDPSVKNGWLVVNIHLTDAQGLPYNALHYFDLGTFANAGRAGFLIPDDPLGGSFRSLASPRAAQGRFAFFGQDATLLRGGIYEVIPTPTSQFPVSPILTTFTPPGYGFTLLNVPPPVFSYDGQQLALYRSIPSIVESPQVLELWTRGGGIASVADTQTAVSGIGALLSFEGIGLDTGRIAFAARSLGREAIYLYAGGRFTRLIETGQLIDGRRVESLVLNTDECFNDDVLLFGAVFADGAKGLYQLQMAQAVAPELLLLLAP